MMYTAREDTLLLINSIKKYHGDIAIEIGVGPGLVCENLKKKFGLVIGTDIDLNCLKYCRNKLSPEILLVCCDALNAVLTEVDLIVSNPPYLPNEENSLRDNAIFGGPSGIDTTISFIERSLPILKKFGKIIVVVSSMSNLELLDKAILRNNLKKNNNQ